jgi:hypothetical protein
MKSKSNGPDDETDDISVIEEFNRWRLSHGFKPRKKAHPRKKVHGVNVSDDAWEGLLFLAEQHGIVYYGVANVSGLLEELGLYRLLIVNKDGHSKLPEIGSDGKIQLG